MLTPISISLTCFLFLLIMGWLRPVPQARRLQASLLGSTGLALIMLQYWGYRRLSGSFMSVVADWLPAIFMLLIYWQAGRIVRKPNERLQSFLHNTDIALFGKLSPIIPRSKYRTYISNVQELAYLFCYPLVPLGVVVLYLAHMRNNIAHYWTAVLLAACFCYVTTIFFETLPPRALPPGYGFPLSSGWVRNLNLWIVRFVSIQINTFPSAHVASGGAAALILLRFAPHAGILYLLIAGGIAAGAITGRYHYILDVILGALIAVAAFLLT